MESVRIDRWVYAVRLFKTRTGAALAVDKGKVKVNNAAVKPSHSVKINDHVQVKDGVLFRSYKVLDLAQKRMGAKLVANFYIETTLPEDLERLQEVQRAKRSFIHFGKGRPTKKDRRDINKYLDS
ncbi:MAG: RNA-binding S4 domain-containing protein [Bacteroidia bacterium]|nr:RNA-binding S4 domain-containing protein [Bacteroidia bacterium]NNC86803.1 RNA-binding S4 domain-containing protein [Bacteroidia bacterium]NNM16429.1 RNA-binding S4 domain-containing protein [Bacteroidia bacterium]